MLVVGGDESFQFLEPVQDNVDSGHLLFSFNHQELPIRRDVVVLVSSNEAARHIRSFKQDFRSACTKSGVAGPTCDSLDMLPFPFRLPDDVREGDWIEIGQLGAYGSALRTQFNGFYPDTFVGLRDDPFIEMAGRAASPVAE